MVRQKQKSLVGLLLCLALVVSLFLPGSTTLRAQEEETPVQVTEMLPSGSVEPSPFDNLAVILVIDISGSMSYTDPLRLRETAAGVFIDLLGADDFLGVVTFDDRAEVVIPLAPAGSPAAKEALIQKLSTELDPRGDTDFVAGLQLAHSQFADTDIGRKTPVILLLTDGEPDPYPGSRDDQDFMAGYMESLWEEVELISRDGILVYTVGFSAEIDPEVIRQIAAETRGQYYILSDPAELLVTFYRALEVLKDRRSFLEESIDFGAGITETFTFEVQEFIRQVNIVIVSSPAEEALESAVTVRPPAGSAAGIEELLLGGRSSYRTLILSRPLEEHYGTWEVEIEGSGEVMLLGNADLYLEALLMEPDPDAHYPLAEPLEIRMEVITRERYVDADFRVEMQVTAPGETSPAAVAMTREGNSFRGTFEDTEQPGEYRLEWTLLKDGEEISKNSAPIQLRALPALTTDFWVDREGLRLGEEMVISVSLASRGERMQQGPHLQVERMTLDLEYRDGARVEVELFDSGNREHGNSRAGDGIWSNRIVFDREGTAEALLTATGTYRDANFILKKSFGFTVVEPGELVVHALPEELWSEPGEILVIPLELISRSPFTQTVRISSDSEDIKLLQDRVIVPPGEEVLFNLETEIAETADYGQLYATLNFTVEDGMTPISPDALDVGAQILTRGEAFRERYTGLGLGVGFILAGLVLIVGVVFGGGSLLYRFYLLPKIKVKGCLQYSASEKKPGPTKKKHQEYRLDLDLGLKNEIVISFDPENNLADYSFDSREYSHDLVINNSWNDHLPRFWRGWKALFSRRLPVRTEIACTPPGIMVVDGKVFSRKDIHPGDEFESGGYLFKYIDDSDTDIHADLKGTNILKDKI
ncbi:MAG: vWA domain-containing protein [Bacillota bacterium]|nr:vWA domain-containing protein [Bacillota bacterium]